MVRFASRVPPPHAIAGSFGGDKNKDVKYGIVDDNCDGFEIDICQDLLLAGLGLFLAAAFGALFTAITMAASKKRRKRSSSSFGLRSILVDLSWLGKVSVFSLSSPFKYISPIWDRVQQF